MPTTPGNAVQTVADIVQVLTKCSKKQADDAELEICKTPKGIATLSMACGISTVAVGVGGMLTIAGVATAGSLSLGGVVLGGAGLIGARKYCDSFVNKGVSTINQANP